MNDRKQFYFFSFLLLSLTFIFGCIVMADGNVDADSSTTNVTVTIDGVDVTYSVTYTADDSGITITKIDEIPTDGKVVIPSTIDSKDVVKIGGDTKAICTNLKSVTIPSSVTSIGSSAFCECNALTELKFADESALTVVGEGAFMNCTGLTTISIPKTVTQLSKNVFSGCTGLTSIGFISEDDWKHIRGYGANWNFGTKVGAVFSKNISLNMLGAGVIPEGSKFETITIVDGGDFEKDCFNGITADKLIIEEIKGKGSSTSPFCNISVKTVKIGAEVAEIPNNYFFLKTGTAETGNATIESVEIEKRESKTDYLTIGESAFKNCSALMEFSFDYVKAIRASAFAGCTALKPADAKYINLLNVEEIANNAFDTDNYGLNVVNISYFGIFIINADGSYTFSKNQPGSLDKSKIFIDGVPYSKEIKFDNGSSIHCVLDATYGGYQLVIVEGNMTALSIEDGWNITSIQDGSEGKGVFSKSNLKTVNLGKNIRYIGGHAFDGSKTVESVVWSSEDVDIKTYAFNKCTALKTIGNADNSIVSVKSVDSSAFRDCTSLTKITYSGDLTLYDSVFLGCSNLIFNDEKTVRITGKINGGHQFSGTAVEKVIFTESCTFEMGGNYFTNCPSLKEVVFEKKGISLTGQGIFENCTSLEKITFGNDSAVNTIYLSSIGDNVFKNTALTDIVIGDCGTGAAVEVGKWAFDSCSKLTDVTFSTYVILKDYAFGNCENLSTISFQKESSDSVGSEIKSNAFGNCVSLVSSKDTGSLELRGVTSIKDYAFNGCVSLASVSMYKCLKDIGIDPFHGCTSLKTSDGTSNGLIIEKGGVMSVSGDIVTYDGGKKIIMINPNVESVVIGKEVTDIAGIVNSVSDYSMLKDTAFSVLPNLKRINVEDGNTTFKSVSGMLVTVDGKLIAVPCSMPSNGYLEISGIDTIGLSAFRNVNVKELVINGLSEAGRLVFCYCSSLEKLTLDSGEKKLTFNMDSFNLTDIDSVTIKGGDLEINNSLSSIKSLTVQSGGNVVFKKASSIDYKDYPVLESLTVSAVNKITWFGGILNNSENLKTLTFASDTLELSDNFIVECKSNNLRVNLAIDSLTYAEGLIKDTSATCYVSDAMGSGSWSGHNNGLIYFSEEYGVLNAVSGTKVYILSDVATVESIESSGTFSVKSDEGYSSGDLIVEVIDDGGRRTKLTCADEKYTIPNYSASVIWRIAIYEADDGSDLTKWHKISFVTNAKSGDPQIDVAPIYVYDGHSILKSSLPSPEYPGFKFVGWFTDGSCTTEYKKDGAGIITADITLYAKWESLGNYLDVDSTAGTFYILNEGGTIGEKYEGKVFSSATVKLKFVPNTGYTLIGISLTNLDKSVVKEDLSVEVSSLTGYACITPVVKYFSSATDLEYVVERNTPKSTDNVVLAWSFDGGKVVQSGMAWSGMPSVPLIVDDRVYIQVNDEIYCLDAKTGSTIKKITTGVSTKQFYHYLGYGGGMVDGKYAEYIVDYTSKKVYRYDLEYVCMLPEGVNYTVWHDGYFYSIIEDDEGSKGKVWKMSPTDLDASGVMNNLWGGTTKDVNAFQYLFGTTSHAVTQGNVMYYISVNGEKISVNALDLETGDYSKLELTVLQGYYLDDGWLTYYNGYLYITAYTKGLFGTYSVTGNAVIGYMKVNGTTIGELKTVEAIKPGSGSTEDEKRDSLTSAFVIQNGRGYLNITKSSQSTVGYFQVYNIGVDGKPEFVNEVSSVASHGSIVASTYNLSKNSEGKLNGEVYIYILNYSVGQCITVFTDVCTNDEWKLSDKAAKFSVEAGFGSQAVRVGTEGQLIFYNDSGKVYCYGTTEFASKYWFFIDSGETAEIKLGDGVDSDAVKAFEKAVANVFGVRKATFDTSDGTVKVAGTTYYVYYYGRDGVAESVKFTGTFSLDDFSKIKTFYLNKEVSAAEDLDADEKWDYVVEDDRHVTTSVKDIVTGLRTYEPITLMNDSLSYVSYGYGKEFHTSYGVSGSIVELKMSALPEKDGYTFVGFTDGETVYKYSSDGSTPKFTLNGHVVLEPVWFENGKSFNGVEVKIGEDVVEDLDTVEILTGFEGTVSVTLDGSGIYTVSSSNGNVLKIADGKITALKAGKAVITVTVSSPIKEQTIAVSVNVIVPTSKNVTVSADSVSLYKGETKTLTATTDLDGKKVVWSSSDPKIATVDSNGKITAISEGVVLITATAEDNSNAKATCTVTVSVKKVTSVTISAASKTVKVGDTFTLTATVAPADAENKKVTWSSSNPSVATVTAGGVVQALSKGTAVITVITADGSYTASCTVTVEGTVSSVSLDKTTLRLEVGSNATLKAITYPDEAIVSNLVWKTSDSSIVTVSGGYVNGVKAGTATVTVSYGDLSAVCTVTVSEKEVIKEDTKDNDDGTKTVTKEEKTVSGDSTITVNTEETKDKDDKSKGAEVKVSAESENKAVKTEATVKKDADGNVVESEVKTTVQAKTETKDGKEVVTISKDDIASALNQIAVVKDSAGGNVEPVIVIDIGKGTSSDSSSVVISFESLTQIADGNDTSLLVNTSAGTLEVTADVIANLSSDGLNLKLGIEKVSDENLTSAVKEKVKDSTVFSLTATLGKTDVHQLGGKVAVTLPYVLKGTNGSDVKIYHVDDNGTLTEMVCSYSNGNVTFVTDHFSYFVVSEKSLVSEASDSNADGINELNTLLKIVVGLLAVLIAMGVVAMVMNFRGH